MSEREPQTQRPVRCGTATVKRRFMSSDAGDRKTSGPKPGLGFVVCKGEETSRSLNDQTTGTRPELTTQTGEMSERLALFLNSAELAMAEAAGYTKVALYSMRRPGKQGAKPRYSKDALRQAHRLSLGGDVCLA